MGVPCHNRDLANLSFTLGTTDATMTPIAGVEAVVVCDAEVAVTVVAVVKQLQLKVEVSSQLKTEFSVTIVKELFVK